MIEYSYSIIMLLKKIRFSCFLLCLYVAYNMIMHIYNITLRYKVIFNNNGDKGRAFFSTPQRTLFEPLRTLRASQPVPCIYIYIDI